MVKRSENDQTADLKQALPDLGFSNVRFDTGAGTKRGGTLKPDLQFHLNGKYYVLEAKTAPAKYDDAVKKAYKDLTEIVEPVEIAFAVLWEQKGRIRAGFVSKDQQGSQKRFSDVRNLAQWILNTCRTKKVVAPVNTDRLLKELNELVDRFYEHYKKIPLQDIQEIFGGKSFFETVLSETGEKEIEVQSLRKIAAFLLVNQMFFYGILAKRTGRYVELQPDKIEGPEYLQKLFDKVLEDDYAPVFGVPVLKVSGNGTLTPDLQYCARAINNILAYEVSHDILGKVFHNLIPLKLRKVVAAYYTNSEAGDLLASLAIDDPNAKIIDPACGSGTLLVSAYRRKLDLTTQNKEASAHQQFLSKDIFGCDIMPFAAHLAAINLTLQKPETFVDSLNILIEDSTTLSPDMTVESAEEKLSEVFRQTFLHEFEKQTQRVQSRKVLKGAVELVKGRHGPVRLDKFDLVIMNPPFTRFQRLTPEYKAKLLSRFPEKKYAKCIHGQLGLQGYFMLLADRFLKPGGRIAAVLPATTFTVKGFFDIMRFFFSNYEAEFIIAGTGRAAFSENTSLREVLFVARNAQPRQDTQANVCFISQSPTDMDAQSIRRLSEKLRKARDEKREMTDEDFFSRRISQKDVVDNPRRLAHLLNLPIEELQQFDLRFEAKARASKRFSQGREIFDSLNWGVFENKRGVERAGYYELSIIPESATVAKDHDFWNLDRESAGAVRVKNRKSSHIFRVPVGSVMPQFRRFSGQTRISLDPPQQFVIANTFSEMITFLRETGASEEKIKKIVKDLGDLTLKKYFDAGSGNAFLFYRGNLSASNSNLLFACSNVQTFAGPGGSWVMTIDTKYLPLMALYFNSSLFLLQLLKERKETEGAFLEVDKYALETIYLPDPRKLSEKEFSRIDSVWTSIKSREWPQLSKQLEEHFEARMIIDREIARLLQIPEDKALRLIKDLQTALARYINVLRTTMGGK